MSEFFGGQRATQHPGDIASAEFLAVKVGAAASVMLVQQVQMDLARQFQPVRGVGMQGVFFVATAAQGSVDIQHAVTKGRGLLALFSNGGGNCGKFGAISLSGAGGGGCNAAPSGAVTAEDSMLESVRLGASAGQAIITSGGRFLITDINVG